MVGRIGSSGVGWGVGDCGDVWGHQSEVDDAEFVVEVLRLDARLALRQALPVEAMERLAGLLVRPERAEEFAAIRVVSS